MLYETIGNYSVNPYYIKELGYSICSIEELCYLLKENLTGLEEGIMSQELCLYVEKNLGLGELGRGMMDICRKRSGFDAFVCYIFEKTGYMGREELKAVETVLQKSSNMNSAQRKKGCGDFYMANQKYVLAIAEYMQAIDELRSYDRKELRGGVFHNIGCAYAKLSLYDKAAEYFKKAYEENNVTESGLQYMAALRLSMDKEAYVKFINEQHLDSELALDVEALLKQYMDEIEYREDQNLLKRARMEQQKADVTSFRHDTDSLLTEWKKSYRRNMEME